MKLPFEWKGLSPLMSLPVKITLLYVLVGGLWVAFSSEILLFLISDPSTRTAIEIGKGWLFVLLTAGILYFLIARGIRVLRRSEEALAESKRTLTTLLSNLPGLAYRCRNDSNWTMEFVSDGCSTLTGYQPDELINNKRISYAELIHPDDRDMVWDDVQSALRENRPFQLAYRIHTAPGEEKWVWEQGRQIPSPGRQPVFLEGLIVDITPHIKVLDELKKHQDHLEELVKQRTQDLESAQRVLIQQEKLKTLGIVAAEVAHGIRNPLVAIGGFAKRLYKKHPELSECGIIYRESQRLEKILDRIKNYLKPVEIRRVPCSVNDVITDCVHLLSPEIERRHITCSLHPGGELSLVYADPDILTQAVVNLMQHAMDSLQDGGELSIKASEDDENLYIDFKNSRGEGALHDPELLFMPFDEGGASIGLPLAYRLVKDLGGILSFSQEEQYVTFTVSLPKIVAHKIS